MTEGNGLRSNRLTAVRRTANVTVVAWPGKLLVGMDSPRWQSDLASGGCQSPESSGENSRRIDILRSPISSTTLGTGWRQMFLAGGDERQGGPACFKLGAEGIGNLRSTWLASSTVN